MVSDHYGVISKFANTTVQAAPTHTSTSGTSVDSTISKTNSTTSLETSITGNMNSSVSSKEQLSKETSTTNDSPVWSTFLLLIALISVYFVRNYIIRRLKE